MYSKVSRRSTRSFRVGNEEICQNSPLVRCVTQAGNDLWSNHIFRVWLYTMLIIASTVSLECIKHCLCFQSGNECYKGFSITLFHPEELVCRFQGERTSLRRILCILTAVVQWNCWWRQSRRNWIAFSIYWWTRGSYKEHTINFQTFFFVWALLLIVHTWNSSLLRLQCTCTVITTSGTSGRPHGSPLVWACQWPSSQPLSYPQLSHNDSL